MTLELDDSISVSIGLTNNNTVYTIVKVYYWYVDKSIECRARITTNVTGQL